MRGRTAIGTHRHLVAVQNPSGNPVSDGDGGYTQPYAAATPATWRCSIEPATARDLERVAAGTIISTASHIVKGRYHPSITVATRLVFAGRVLAVTGVSDPEERHLETICICVELIGAVLLLDAYLAQVGLFQDGLVQEGFA
jgi:head-tail adaptor